MCLSGTLFTNGSSPSLPLHILSKTTPLYIKLIWTGKKEPSHNCKCNPLKYSTKHDTAHFEKNLLINWWHKESAVQSAAEKLCINNHTVDICSPLTEHFTVFHNAFSFTGFLTDVCYIFWFDMAAHVKKIKLLNNSWSLQKKR